MFLESNGQIPEWPNGADCKSAGLRLRWFESIFAHPICGSSSVDRALAFQAEGRGFESRLPLTEESLARLSFFCSHPSARGVLELLSKHKQATPSAPIPKPAYTARVRHRHETRSKPAWSAFQADSGHARRPLRPNTPPTPRNNSNRHRRIPTPAADRPPPRHPLISTEPKSKRGQNQKNIPDKTHKNENSDRLSKKIIIFA